MYFYRIEIKLNKDEEKRDNDAQRAYTLDLQAKSAIFQQKNRDGTIFISSIGAGKLSMGAITRDHDWLEKNISGFLSAIDIECHELTTEEITFVNFKIMLKKSESSDLISEYNNVLDQFGLNELHYISYLSLNELMLPESVKKDNLLRKARNMLCINTLAPELERIFQPAKQSVCAHPVHYIFQCDNSNVCDGVSEVLLSALYTNGRLRNRRYCIISIESDSDFDWGEFKAMYEACTDGAVVVKCIRRNSRENDDICTDMSWLDHVCRTVSQYKNKTLTLFCLPRTAERIKSKILEHLDSMTLIEISEDFVSGERAKAFLKKKARDTKIPTDKSLYKTIGNEKKEFSASELSKTFDIWLNNRLKTFCYPQYSNFQTSGSVMSKRKPLGDAYSELEQMVGLAESKAVIKRAIDYFKAQKLFRDRGLKSDQPSMHMVFTGSPGTAKTTVARLFAQIMRENDILSVGSLYEVGRADLVGRYVGWTAKVVQEKFQDAMGSVLFIDEAYSLVDDREGLFGDEAINTIVAEMENHREDLVVIFAGYTDKMEAFLRKNPGLRSRIAFHVPFADYDTEELMQILGLLAEKQSMSLDDSVRGKVMPILSAASKDPDFGNGRFVRTLFEMARMKQAERLLAMDVDSVTSEHVTQLIADDFEAPLAARNVKNRIGF